MKLTDNIKNEIRDIVAGRFETGHGEIDRFELSTILVQEYPEAGMVELSELLKDACEYYDELLNLGPVGFYEEFKDEYDFDPMFIEEYGHYYDDEE
jgi:hypothetical protein